VELHVQFRIYYRRAAGKLYVSITIFLHSVRPAVGPTQPRIDWVPVVFFLCLSDRGVKLIVYLQAVVPFPHVPPSHVQRQLYPTSVSRSTKVRR
jgi:hypothetical protein